MRPATVRTGRTPTASRPRKRRKSIASRRLQHRRIRRVAEAARTRRRSRRAALRRRDRLEAGGSFVEMKASWVGPQVGPTRAWRIHTHRTAPKSGFSPDCENSADAAGLRGMRISREMRFWGNGSDWSKPDKGMRGECHVGASIAS